jgi:hypothetical protein
MNVAGLGDNIDDSIFLADLHGYREVIGGVRREN